MHVHDAVVAHAVTGKLALDFHAGRRLLVHGRSRLGDRERRTGSSLRSPTGSRAWSTRASSTPTAGTAFSKTQRVSVWYTAPTAVRMMMKAGEEVARAHTPSRAPVHRQRRGAA